MSNFVKENINANLLVVNNEISRLVEIIGIHENTVEMTTENLVYLATALYMCRIRSAKERYESLVKDIVVFALTKRKYNNMFGIEEEDLINYDLSTNKRVDIVMKDLVDMFVNNADIRKQLLWLIKDEYSSISTNKNK